MRKWLIPTVTLAFLAGPLTLLAQTPPEKPAISTRFETPRDFGYHIGDPIPLTLLIETESGAVVDLESLPHQGETVGPFEVRNVRISHSGSAYRIEFVLQTFVPATSAMGVVFPPLELRFALAEDRLADGGYVYRMVTLPPHVFFLSPTATGPRALRANKGSMVPRTGWLFWGSVSLGALSIVMAVVMLAWDLGRWWQRRSRDKRSKAEARALRTLSVLRERYLACEEMTPVLFVKINSVLRRFLREQCGIPAHVETMHQIREQFRGHPLERELAEVLERCNAVIYDAYHPTPSEKEGILRGVVTLIGDLERVGCPTHGGNGAAR